MKERAVQLARKAAQGTGLNVLREYLQSHILFSLQSARAFEELSFVGGTALRLLYGLRRFSEDLDFSLERPERYDFRRLLNQVKGDLVLAGFEVDLSVRQTRTVHTASVRMAEILHELGLSPHRTAKLAIRVEIDTVPPPGASTTTTLIDRHFLLALHHHDLPSLMAGKLHALLSRPFTKGRDIYDLLWYLTRPEPVRPNIVLLRNALTQTGWQGAEITDQNWPQAVEERLRHADFRLVADDVAPLLETPEERALLSWESVQTTLRRASTWKPDSTPQRR